jgi:hypothetical protein
MSIPGLMYPTQKGSVAGNPRDSALATTNNMNAKQNSINGLAGGRKRYMGGVGNTKVIVPQFPSSYQETSGTGTGTNAQIAALSATSMQGTENAKYDANIKNGGTKNGGTKNGGTKNGTKKRRGGNPNWHWPCKSGGKKRKTRKTRKSRKTRK